MDIAHALQIVIDLAKANVVNESCNPATHREQVEALAAIEDLAVNEYGDD